MACIGFDVRLLASPWLPTCLSLTPHRFGFRHCPYVAGNAITSKHLVHLFIFLVGHSGPKKMANNAKARNCVD